MTAQFTAIYEHGLLRPTAPLPVPEGTLVEVILVVPPTPIRLPDWVPTDEISAPCDLPRSSNPEIVAAVAGSFRLPDPVTFA